MVDYVQDPTPHDNFDGGSATWVVWARFFFLSIYVSFSQSFSLTLSLSFFFLSFFYLSFLLFFFLSFNVI